MYVAAPRRRAHCGAGRTLLQHALFYRLLQFVELITGLAIDHSLRFGEPHRLVSELDHFLPRTDHPQIAVDTAIGRLIQADPRTDGRSAAGIGNASLSVQAVTETDPHRTSCQKDGDTFHDSSLPGEADFAGRLKVSLIYPSGPPIASRSPRADFAAARRRRPPTRSSRSPGPRRTTGPAGHHGAGMDRGEAGESVYSLIGFSVREIRPHLSAGRRTQTQFAGVLAVRAAPPSVPIFYLVATTGNSPTSGTMRETVSLSRTAIRCTKRR